MHKLVKPLLRLPECYRPRPCRRLPDLFELREVIEHFFWLAATEERRLEPTRDGYWAAYVDLRAELGLAECSMQEHMRESLGVTAELEERARQVCLMRLYLRSWRPADPEGGIKHRCRGMKPRRKPRES